MTDLIEPFIRESKVAENSNSNIGWLGRIQCWLVFEGLSND